MIRQNRRSFFKTAGGAVAALAAPVPLVWAQGTGAGNAKPIRIGLLTVKTGTLAAAGKQLEDGIALLLDQRNRTLAGRKVELIAADTAGQPAQARTKARELVERDKVDVLIGPLAAFDALAIIDYVNQVGIPTFLTASAEDLTQRKASPWVVRTTGSAAQFTYPLADHAAKTLGYKRIVTIAEDVAYGHEVCGGFLRAFEEAGGKVVQRLWAPFNATDYGAYIAQIKTEADAVLAGFAGQNPVRFIKQYAEFGLKGRIPLLGTLTMTDESILRVMGAEADGIVSSSCYAAGIDTPANRALRQATEQATGLTPGYYNCGSHAAGLVIEQALAAVDGRIEDRAAFMKAVRAVRIADDPRGTFSFDEYGNPVTDQQVFRVTMGEDGKLSNRIIKTYPSVSQFWTYKPDEFLKNPVYSRDYPQARFIE